MPRRPRRPAAAIAAGSEARGSLSSNGRPGTRQGVRTPHLSCGNARRRVFPCRLLRRPRRVFRHLARQPVRHAPRRALPLLRHDGVLPVPRDASHHGLVRRHAGFPGIARFRALRLPGRWWCRPHPRATADMADRALRCVDRLRCSVCSLALGRHRWVTPSRRALPSRPCRAWRPIDAGTLAPRHHAGTNFLLTRTLAATGLEAIFAPRHYRIPALGGHGPQCDCDFVRQPAVVTGHACCDGRRMLGERLEAWNASSKCVGAPRRAVAGCGCRSGCGPARTGCARGARAALGQRALIHQERRRPHEEHRRRSACRFRPSRSAGCVPGVGSGNPVKHPPAGRAGRARRFKAEVALRRHDGRQHCQDAPLAASPHSAGPGAPPCA